MTKKVYARQINLEYQESPLMLDDIFPNNIIVCGNKDYKAHTIPEYDHIMDYFDDMANDYDDCKKQSIAELLRYYGFYRNDGKSWTNKQKHEWRMLMESGDSSDDDEIILSALRLLTGKKWNTCGIHGCCQSDWQDIYYPVDEWDIKAIECFESEYFNLGSEWEIHDSDIVLESVDDISGYCVYCYSWDEYEIQAEIANIVGCNPDDVILCKYGEETIFDTVELEKVS